MGENILYDCPFCEEEHYVQLKREQGVANIKGEIVQYDKIVYYCDIEEEEFCPRKLMDNNLLEARNVYRRMKGLLTSKEIKV